MAEAESKTESSRKKAPSPSDNETELASVEVEVEVVDEKDKAKEAAKSVQIVRDITNKDSEMFRDLSREIFRINDEKLYLYIDNPRTGDRYKTFKDFAEVELPYSERRAAYMIAIWKKWVLDLGEGEETIMDAFSPVGWAKMKELLKVIDHGNVDYWLDKSKTLSVRQLQQLIKDEASEEPGNSPTPNEPKTDSLKGISFRQTEKQRSNLDHALAIAQSVAKGDGEEESNKSVLLDIVSLDFISGNDINAPLESILQRIESNLGISIVAFRKTQIVYGEDALDRAIAQGEEDPEE